MAGVTFPVNRVAPEAKALHRAQLTPRGWVAPFLKLSAKAKPADGRSGRFSTPQQAPFPWAGLISADACTSHPTVLAEQAHGHGFISAVTTAFDLHLPLSLRPEHFWVLIVQGVAKHVNANAEELRPKFVNHEGKETLVVECDDFIAGPGAVGHDWAGVVAGFSRQIGEKTVPGVAELVDTDFSTTTPEERVAAQVTIMDMVQSFFNFKMTTCCGFPTITLEGEADDWVQLRAKAETLVSEKCTREFADMWLPALASALERIVAQVEASQNAGATERQSYKNVDVKFWQSMCKRGGTKGSGSRTWLNGWFNAFFPILKAGQLNPYCVPYEPSHGYAKEPVATTFYGMAQKYDRETTGGPDIGDLPGGMAAAPVLWDYLGTEIPLSFQAGFVGAVQRADGTIAPELGWCICKAPAHL